MLPGSEAFLAPWVHRVAAKSRRAMIGRLEDEDWLQAKGFRPPCIGALHMIAERQPLSQRELSECMGIDPSDTVAVVDILEEAGYVTRARDPVDRRRHALTLTANGDRTLAQLRQIAAEVEEEILAPLSKAERATLNDLLRRVAEG